MHKRWAVFISGTGSNMMTLLEKRSLLPITLIVSSHPEATGVLRARFMSVPVKIFKKEDSWNTLSQELRDFGISYIFLAGFMRVLPPEFVRNWKNRIFNIHPSFLPQYPGLKSIEKAFQDGAASGVTIHQVDEGIDTGRILLQKRLEKKETLQQTEFYTHVAEHNMIRQFCENLKECI